MIDKEQSLDLLHNEAKEATQAHPKGTPRLIQSLLRLSFFAWIISIIVFVGSTILFKARSDGSYSQFQSLVFIVSIVIGSLSFLIFIFSFLASFFKKINIFSFSRRFIGKGTVFILVLLAIGFWASGWVSARIFDSISEGKGVLGTPAQTEDMLARINQERAKAGVAPLEYWKDLATTAKEKACDMENRKYFDHKDPEGRRGFHYIFDANLPVERVGENIAQGFTDRKEEMDTFMKSAEHKENILEPYWQYVGYAQCGDYFVQHFAEHSHE